MLLPNRGILTIPSFDVVSTVNMQEVLNAVDQTKREIGTRYDFKDADASVELLEKESLVVIEVNDRMHLTAVQQILREKLARRSVSLKSVEFEEPEKAGGDRLRAKVKIKQALDSDELKALSKEIRQLKFKVQAQIQGDQLRISGKKRDDLQTVMTHLRAAMPELELQFVNFRD